MFEIDKDIPVAPRNATKPATYPFAQMEVGDSFAAPRDLGLYGKIDKRQNIIGASARGYARRHNPSAQFTVRLIDENTVRCWRIA